MRQPESGANRVMQHGLRVGVVEESGVAEVALLRGHGQITIGRSRSNDIVVSDSEAPRRMPLLRLSNQGLSISTATALEGDVWLDLAGVTLSMDELREAQAHPGLHQFAPLDDHSRGFVEAWGKRVVFQLIEVCASPKAGWALRDARAVVPAMGVAALAMAALISLLPSVGLRRAVGIPVERSAAPGVAEGTQRQVTVTPLDSGGPGGSSAPTASSKCAGNDFVAAVMAPLQSLDPSQPPFDSAISDWEGVGMTRAEGAVTTVPRGETEAHIAVAERSRALKMGRVVLPQRAREKALPSVGGEEFIADGMLTPRAAALEIERRRGAVTASFERALRHDPHLAGRLNVRFTVDGGGNVTAVRVLHDTVGDRALRDELERTLKTWRFPAPASGPVSFTFHFLFRPTHPPRVS